jgi:hypothetical protein
MTSGISLFLIAVGAILYFAVNASVSGIEIDTVGLILMIVGAVGFLWSILVLYGARDRTEGGACRRGHPRAALLARRLIRRRFAPASLDRPSGRLG